MNNSEIRRIVLSLMLHYLDQALNQNKLMWLGRFVDAHRTPTSLCAILRDRQWLEDWSKWPVDGMAV